MAKALPGNVDVRAELLAQAKRRKELLDAADKIDEQYFKPLGLSPDTLLPRPVAPSSTELVLQLAQQQGGTVSCHAIAELFKQRGKSQSPYVVVTRLVQAGKLQREGRGEYSIVVKKRRK